MKKYLKPDVDLLRFESISLFCTSIIDDDNNKGTLPGPIEVDPWGM